MCTCRTSLAGWALVVLCRACEPDWLADSLDGEAPLTDVFKMDATELWLVLIHSQLSYNVLRGWHPARLVARPGPRRDDVLVTALSPRHRSGGRRRQKSSGRCVEGAEGQDRVK